MEPADAREGDWIAPRLGPFGGWVGSVAPRGYAAYARVLHPVDDGRGRLMRWDRVCAATGRTPHALMQWLSLGWPDGQPDAGNLDAAALRALCRVLIDRTPAPECFFALWEGWGWVDGGGVFPRPARPAYPPEVLARPRLQLPNRNYLLFGGPLTGSPSFANPYTDRLQSPSLCWPADRSWCVATEIDFDSTIVAGGAELVAAVLASPELEAWPVGPDDSLALVSPAGGTAPGG